jgi:acetyl coenzyme A synthetase (ADP forming)-like protein
VDILAIVPDILVSGGGCRPQPWRRVSMSAPSAVRAQRILLSDGTPANIRRGETADRAALDEFLRHLRETQVAARLLDDSADSRGAPTFDDPDPSHQATLLVELPEADGPRLVGAGRYVVSGGDRPVGEMILAVAEGQRGRGVGTLLLERLLALAREGGIGEFQADVVGEQNRLLDMLAGSGLMVTRSLRAGYLHVTFPTAKSDQLEDAEFRREWRASGESMRRLLHPGSVAVIGASREPGSIGHQILHNLIADRFTGAVYPVNPKAERILGIPCYPSITAIGRPVDLAIVSVPAPYVEQVLEECAQARARGAVVITAGFAEVSAEGRSAQDRLVGLVRRHGLRMIGPNCMGVVNTDPAVSLNGTFAPIYPPAGNVAFLSQSGALGLAILDYARTLNIGISTFVSAGNKADVSGNDLLAYWSDDPRTAVIALYLESFGNPRKFARLAREVARHKPIVAVKSGRSAAGTRAAASHSAALAALDVAVDTLFEQAGVIRTGTLEELFDVVTLLATQPVPSGPRVAVVTNAGGPGILVADACEAQGLSLPELSPESVARLREYLPAAAGLKNPIDMIASASPEEYRRTIEIVGNDPGVDSLVVLYVPPLAIRPEDIAQAIAAGAGAVPRDKPVLTVFLSSRGAPELLRQGPRGALPSFSFPENAARALAAAEKYARWLRRPSGAARTLDAFATGAVRAVIARALDGAEGPRWLDPLDVATVLRAAGIRLAATEQALPEQAVSAAEKLGYPLVAKAVAPGLVHKSDVGGVVLGLRSAADVERAVATLRDKLHAAGHELEAVLLQREVEGGVEAIVGVMSDPLFGPLVVCGLGGVLVELLRDASFRLPPVTDVDAAEMIDRLRLAPLLAGYRGAPPADRAALEETIVRVSALVEAAPEIREMDLNPVKILAKGSVVVDARIRVAASGFAPLG